MKNVFRSAVLVGVLGVAYTAYALTIPPGGIECRISPCLVPNSRTFYFAADVSLLDAVRYQLIVNGNRMPWLVDVTNGVEGTITFPVAMGPGTYEVFVRTITNAGWRDSSSLTLIVTAGNPRVTVVP